MLETYKLYLFNVFNLVIILIFSTEKPFLRAFLMVPVFKKKPRTTLVAHGFYWQNY